MNTAEVQENFRSGAADDWADIQEPQFMPVYEAVLRQSGLRKGQRVLDIGCGAGLFCRSAANKGAVVAGIDVAGAMIDMARSRTGSADFHVADMQALPFADGSFDLVAGFNSFQFAADPADALREVRRVMKPRALLAIAAWGAVEDCQAAAFLRAQASMLRPKAASAAGPFTLSAPGALESILAYAGLRATTFGEVATPFVFDTADEAFRALVSSQVGTGNVRQIDAEALRSILMTTIVSFKRSNGSYRMENTVRYLLAEA